MGPDSVDVAGRGVQVTWQSWAYLLLFVLLNLSIGSFFSFSFWKAGFLKYFHEWNRDDLKLIYSLGGIGSFICIIPGGMYDKFGPRATFLYGLVMTNVGFIGVLGCMRLAESAVFQAPPVLVGIFYLIEEQGASSFYMAGCCYLIKCFSDSLVPVASGVFAVAYGLSVIFWQDLLPLFGFTEDVKHQDPNLFAFLGAVLLAINVFAVIALFVCVPDKAETEIKTSSTETKDGGFSFLLRLEFLAVLGLFGLATVNIASFFGYMANVPAAFTQLDSTTFSNIALFSNVAARIIFGGVGMVMVQKFGAAGNHMLLVFCSASMIAFFAVMLMSAVSGEANAPLVYTTAMLAFGAFGGAGPVMSSHVNMSFDSAQTGIIVGMVFTTVAFINLGVGLFGPTNEGHFDSIKRLPQDFIRPWTIALVGCSLSLPMLVLLLAKALKDGSKPDLENKKTQ